MHQGHGFVKALDPRLTVVAKRAGVRPPHVFQTWHAIREMGLAFDAEAFAQFAMLEPKHITGIMDVLTELNLLPKVAIPKAGNKRLLHEDFVMPADWILWACTQRGWTQDVAKTEADSFKDYWLSHAKPMADWQAVWRNWVRRSNKEDGNWKPNADMSKEQRLALCDRSIEIARKMGRTEDVREWERKKQALQGAT